VSPIRPWIPGLRRSRADPGASHANARTGSTRLIRDHGRDFPLVADVLGHADVIATRRYARSEFEHRRAAPRSKGSTVEGATSPRERVARKLHRVAPKHRARAGVSGPGSGASRPRAHDGAARSGIGAEL
jgi:hypothetical protein